MAAVCVLDRDAATGRTPRESPNSAARPAAWVYGWQVTIHALSSLIERERELLALEGLVAAARSGDGGVAVVQGPPGIGKSRLLKTVRETVTELRVLRARASELERDMPFGVVRQLIEPVLAEADDAERAELLRGAASLALPVLNEIGSARVAQDSALHGLYWLTVNLAGARPVLIVVDDLHWADLPSLHWIVYMAQRVEGVPAAIVVATRPDELGSVGDLVDALLAIPAVDLIRPAALSEAAVAQMASQMLSTEPDAAFVEACLGVTGGNPFLLHELLNELAESGVAPTAAAAATVSRLSSDAVSRSAMTRLRRLPDACRELADAVLTLGDGVELERAAHLAQLDLDSAAEAADALETAFIFAPGRPLAFVHPLVRASVYAKLSAGGRAGLHARAAMMLTTEGASPERVAVHWLAADPAGSQDAVETLRTAATRAAQTGAPACAIDYLRRALREPPAPELVPHVTLELGLSELNRYQAGAALEHFHRAFESLPDPAARGHAANLLGIASMFAGGESSTEVVGLLSDAIANLPADERELGLRLETTRYSVAHLRVPAWHAYQQQARQFTCEDNPTTIGERLYVGILAGDAGRTGRADDARRLAMTALGDGRLLEDLGPSDPSFFIPVSTLFYCDATEEALRELHRVLEWARRNGSSLAVSFASNFLAMAWMRRGMLKEVEIEAAELIDAAGGPRVRNGLVALCEARVFAGDIEGAASIWDGANMDSLVAPPRRLCDYYLQARARLRVAQGRPAEALEDLFACGSIEEAYGVKTPQNTTWRSDAATLLADLGRPDEGRPLVEEELVRARAFGSLRQIGTALRAAARLEPRETALELHREAEEVLGASDDRLGHALALVELGGALRRAGQRKQARDRLSQAIEVARVCGAAPVATRAHDELVAAGARPRRDPTESRSQLTASETRVARLAAEGMTNREIAQALFLTEKTIEVHLTSTYRKLDIRSRSQLLRALGARTEAA
jgi:DNA-binding CsgD family transcriptional regulator